MNSGDFQARGASKTAKFSSETGLCFAAAAGCFVLGVIGYAINALSATETTLSAFLVISAFYAMLGVISLFKAKPSYAVEQAKVSDYRSSSIDEEAIESAA